MYEFHYDYMQLKYGRKVKVCYMDTESFVYEIEKKNIYEDIAKDAQKSFDASGYSKDDNRPLPIGKNKKVIGMMKDELGGKNTFVENKVCCIEGKDVCVQRFIQKFGR